MDSPCSIAGVSAIYGPIIDFDLLWHWHLRHGAGFSAEGSEFFGPGSWIEHEYRDCGLLGPLAK